MLERVLGLKRWPEERGGLLNENQDEWKKLCKASRLQTRIAKAYVNRNCQDRL